MQSFYLPALFEEQSSRIHIKALKESSSLGANTGEAFSPLSFINQRQSSAEILHCWYMMPRKAS